MYSIGNLVVDCSSTCKGITRTADTAVVHYKLHLSTSMYQYDSTTASSHDSRDGTDDK